MFIPAAGWLTSCASSLGAYLACHACTCLSREVLTQSARVAWSALFFVAMVVAWVLRDFAKPLLEKIPCEPTVLLLVACEDSADGTLLHRDRSRRNWRVG